VALPGSLGRRAFRRTQSFVGPEASLVQVSGPGQTSRQLSGCRLRSRRNGPRLAGVRGDDAGCGPTSKTLKREVCGDRPRADGARARLVSAITRLRWLL
jgi:hypothetical protein